MKKLLCLVIVLCMAMSFAGCAGILSSGGDSVKSTKSIAGTYAIYEMTTDGETMTIEELENTAEYYEITLEELCYLQLNKDGTGELCVMGDATDLEWDEDYIWLNGDERISYTVFGNKISLEKDDTEMIFKK